MTSAPPRPSLLLALSTQSALLSELFLALPAGAEGIPALHAALVSSAGALDSLSLQAREHQRAWARLCAQQGEVAVLERRVRALVRELEGARVGLEGMVEEGRRVREGIDKSEKDPVGVPVILAHAHALARTTSAPVSSLLAPGQQSAPWPTEMDMRQGLLFQLEGSMSGVGDVGVVGEEPTEDKAEPRHEVVHEDPGRRYDPGAVFELDLNSDSDDD